tara:strand:- start:1061 stop:1459 length:399 start_codon:yes stop_codon:yes gene_type:complete
MSLCINSVTEHDVGNILQKLKISDTGEAIMSTECKELYDAALEREKILKQLIKDNDKNLKDKKYRLIEATNNLNKCTHEAQQWRHRKELAEISFTATEEKIKKLETHGKTLFGDNRHADRIVHQIYDWVYDA